MTDRSQGPDTPPPWADLLRQEVPGLPEEWRGIVSVVPPATEPAPPITRDMIREAAERITAGAVFSPTSEYRPRRTGDMLEVMGRLLAKVEEANSVRFVLAPAKWHAIMSRATEDERVVLERELREGRVILSEFLPEPETAYRIQLPRTDRARVPWFLR